MRSGGWGGAGGRGCAGQRPGPRPVRPPLSERRAASGAALPARELPVAVGGGVFRAPARAEGSVGEDVWGIRRAAGGLERGWEPPGAVGSALGRSAGAGPAGSKGCSRGGAGDFRTDFGAAATGEGTPRRAERLWGTRRYARAAGGDARDKRCGREAPVRGQGLVHGWPGGKGRREQAAHQRGCAYLGLFDDRPPFPSFAPSLPLSWPYRGAGAKPFLVSRS